MDFIKNNLLDKLNKNNAFWSYEKVQLINNDDLIEHVLINLDIDDIERLFLIFDKNHVRKIWKERLIKQEPYYHNLNIFIASVYFEIKHPVNYISRIKKQVQNY